MFWHQTSIQLRPRPRGFHLITGEVLGQVPEAQEVRVGMMNFFLQHTSASLALGENADPDVRADLERWSRHAVPDGAPYFRHDAEGPDDMPAHVKSALYGAGMTVPIRDGRPALGTWQGLYLGEHRDRGGSRTLVVTLWGQKAQKP